MMAGRFQACSCWLCGWQCAASGQKEARTPHPQSSAPKPHAHNAHTCAHGTPTPPRPTDEEGTGWTFSPCNVESFKETLTQALKTLREHPESFAALQLRGMRRDSSWDKAAQNYEQIFDWATSDPPYAS